MADHLADVASSDQHTVKPWFTGKLTFSPPVRDFAANGFPLIGGRLDYLDRQPVAALVYGRNRHRINVFLWPAAGGDDRPRWSDQRGYHLAHWRSRAMHYWVISDLNATELGELVALLSQP
jgi:anti-sigma factor RsiW